MHHHHQLAAFHWQQYQHQQQRRQQEEQQYVWCLQQQLLQQMHAQQQQQQHSFQQQQLFLQDRLVWGEGASQPVPATTTYPTPLWHSGAIPGPHQYDGSRSDSLVAGPRAVLPLHGASVFTQQQTLQPPSRNLDPTGTLIAATPGIPHLNQVKLYLLLSNAAAVGMSIAGIVGSYVSSCSQTCTSYSRICWCMGFSRPAAAETLLPLHL